MRPPLASRSLKATGRSSLGLIPASASARLSAERAAGRRQQRPLPSSQLCLDTSRSK
eukprot:CAMPEP_0170643562 /NCGR_PEP_ID=MMETSP0224-20130122/41958_1 /TAXON_ID=285029 /ORGANISM="Togula jolla, Strain CCCM 725" /LENGTH=56 /DNA_ID=CAMNT_0010974411 /DNA_START=92 /DNA_END=262 /DNA_ORIENTATION=-